MGNIIQLTISSVRNQSSNIRINTTQCGNRIDKNGYYQISKYSACQANRILLKKRQRKTSSRTSINTPHLSKIQTNSRSGFPISSKRLLAYISIFQKYIKKEASRKNRSQKGMPPKKSPTLSHNPRKANHWKLWQNVRDLTIKTICF